ncbi:MAG: Fis family transcriptional regulator [Gammaproteobacteria bacterium]|nr:MAG: Fis family transcriptional regulator [Gammaproteobacteria bacterium]
MTRTSSAPLTQRKKNKKVTLEKAIKQLVGQYFTTIEQHQGNGVLHQELIRRVERELIHQVMKHTEHNQSQTAKILGISRTTLRKKLDDYQL